MTEIKEEGIGDRQLGKIVSLLMDELVGISFKGQGKAKPVFHPHRCMQAVTEPVIPVVSETKGDPVVSGAEAHFFKRCRPQAGKTEKEKDDDCICPFHRLHCTKVCSPIQQRAEGFTANRGQESARDACFDS